MSDYIPDYQSFQCDYGILNIKSANQTLLEASQKPIPKELFGELWHQGELCVLFADTGIGKSILAVQIGQSIASGEPIDGFMMKTEPRVRHYG